MTHAEQAAAERAEKDRQIADSLQLERCVLAGLLADDTGKHIEAVNGMPASAFNEGHYARLFMAIARKGDEQLDRSDPYEAAKASGLQINDIFAIQEADSMGMLFYPSLKKLKARYRQQATEKALLAAKEADDPVKRARELLDEIDKAVPAEGQKKDEVADLLASRRFRFLELPAKPAPRLFLNHHPVCTPGNLTNLIAQSKAGKSAAIAAAISAILATSTRKPEDLKGLDLLGWSSGRNEEGKWLIHIDTEQSIYDHDQLVRRALRRAGIEEPPAWFHSYCLTGTAPDRMWSAISSLLEKANEAKTGVFALIIDGTADLVNDVNDLKECRSFVANLQSTAIKYDCPIIGIVHENPGQDIGKMRGHLGSELERKAESNLRLKKADGVTVIFSEKQRGAPIMESEGPRFAWSNELSMHVSVDGDPVQKKKDADKRERYMELAKEVFINAPIDGLSYSQIITRIQSIRKITASSAEDRFGDMKRSGCILKKPFSTFWSVTP